jgi:hypothetical protein
LARIGPVQARYGPFDRCVNKRGYVVLQAAMDVDRAPVAVLDDLRSRRAKTVRRLAF